jgi:ubiquitin-protein ligase
MLNPTYRRLKTDYDKVLKLAVNSGGSLRLLRTTGDPPKSYVIEYHCPSLVKSSTGQMVISNVHQVEINLGINYPTEKPTARMLTPVCNPHVFDSNAICLGNDWSVAETLDNLILRIGALLQLDPKVLNPKSLANSAAYEWITKNPGKIPLGYITFKARQEPPRRISWS